MGLNVRALANRVTTAVNPNVAVTLCAFHSYTVSASGKTVPSYREAVYLVGQAQALTKAEIQHLDAMNISNCERAIYVNGKLQAYDRFEQTGGDMLYFENQWWLVMAILEGWSTAGWTRAALVRQNQGPTPCP